MRVIIAGSRNINDLEMVKYAVLQSGFEITEVVSGNASGIDRQGEIYAHLNNIPVKVFEACWSAYGRSAGPIRNQLMIDYADALIAIPGTKESRGTWDIISKAKRKGLRVFVY